MDIYIIIPCYNEEKFIEATLTSLINQSLKAKKICVVNDNSTDRSGEIIQAFAKAHSEICFVNTQEKSQHLPGSKVINAFNAGLKTLDNQYDIICKFDADLIFPPNYLEEVAKSFAHNDKAGMAGGFCHVKVYESWQLENLTNKDHIRGALKAYRKSCFKQIGGLKAAMGWDTVDELLARYHNWEVITVEHLAVKHLKPTGNTYTKEAKFKQGEAFYTLRYGFPLTCIASLKLAFKKKNASYFVDYMRGYFRAKRKQKKYLVTPLEGNFIRKLRWKGIQKKLFKS